VKIGQKAPPHKTTSKLPASIQIKLTDILVTDRLRALQPETVAAIAESFEAIGQLQPVVVRAGGPHTANHTLVAGNRRLEAARQLGWKTIAAVVVEDIDNELAEIDENLIRAELSPAERKLHIGRRKELYEAKHPATRHGGDRRSSSQPENLKTTPAFVANTAVKTGRGRSTIARDVRHAKAVKVLGEIAGTSLDTDSEIEALSRLPAEQQRDLAEHAKASRVTAKPPSPKSDSDQDTAEPVKLLHRLDELLCQNRVDWQMVAEAVGRMKFYEIVARLKRVNDEHAAKNATKAIADRIETKSRAAASNDDLAVPAFLDRRKMH
jgi:hypothetical protein